jgi:hypothetical protein
MSLDALLLLWTALHVSGTHMPIIRSLRLYHCVVRAAVKNGEIKLVLVSLVRSVAFEGYSNLCPRTVDNNPGGGEISRTCPDRPWGPPSFLYNGYRVFPWGKERPGRAADHSPPCSAVVMEE